MVGWFSGFVEGYFQHLAKIGKWRVESFKSFQNVKVHLNDYWIMPMPYFPEFSNFPFHYRKMSSFSISVFIFAPKEENIKVP